MKFGKDFYWGGSVSANQIEGSFDVKGKGMSISDTMELSKDIDWKKIPKLTRMSTERFNSVLENPTKGYFPKRNGVNFYNKYKEDIELFSELGINVFRTSIAWTRIFPKGDESEPNEDGLKFYEDMFKELQSKGITILLTVSHFEIPTHLVKEYGGWKNRKVYEFFKIFLDVIVEKFNKYVKFWIAFNEINVAYFIPYFGSGIILDQYDKKNWNSIMYQALHYQFLATAYLVKILKVKNKECKVGAMVSYDTSYYEKCDPNDVIEQMKYDQEHNEFCLDVMIFGEYPGYTKRIFEEKNIKIDTTQEELKLLKENTCSYVSISYYSSSVISADNNLERVEGNLVSGFKNKYLKSTEWGWQIDPQGFRYALNKIWNKYKLPIFVSENGIGLHDTFTKDNKVHDNDRIYYLETHIKEMHNAIVLDGVDVIGYTMWGLMDIVAASTAEMSKRYGVIYVDQDDYGNGTQNRYRKDSFFWMKKMIEESK